MGIMVSIYQKRCTIAGIIERPVLVPNVPAENLSLTREGIFLALSERESILNMDILPTGGLPVAAE